MLKVRELLGFRCWDRTCSTWEAYLRWKTRGFPSEARALLSVSNVHERNKAALLLSPSKQHKRVPTSTCSIDIPKKRDDLQTLQKHLGICRSQLETIQIWQEGIRFRVCTYIHSCIYSGFTRLSTRISTGAYTPVSTPVSIRVKTTEPGCLVPRYSRFVWGGSHRVYFSALSPSQHQGGVFPQ